MSARIRVPPPRRRVWDCNNTQLARCWRARPSPQNFNLFHASAHRTPHR